MKNSAHPLTEIAEIFPDLIAQNRINDFKPFHEKLTANPLFDEIIDGIFSKDATTCRTLHDNSLLAAIYALAANASADSDYARVAISTLNNILAYHPMVAGLYVETIEFQDTTLDWSLLQQQLDEAQKSVIHTAFDFPDRGVFQWHSLVRKVSLSRLSEMTGLHPKQVPLAYDGALQLIRHHINAPQSASDIDVDSNVIFCLALLFSGVYLNQTQHAEAALTLITQLKQQPKNKWWEILLLQRLSYLWDEADFNSLIEFMSHRKHAPSQVSRELIGLVQPATPATSSAQNSSEHHSGDIFERLLAKANTVVLISGPAYQIRQWLQLVSNQYNPHVWCFARPAECETSAIISRNGNIIAQITALDELITAVSDLDSI